MSHKQYNEKFMISINKTEKIDNIKIGGDMSTTEEIVSLKQFNDYESKEETGPDSPNEQDEGNEVNSEKAGSSENSQMSVLRFRTFILKIGGFEKTNYRAMERILAMDTSSEESIIQAAQDYCHNTG